MWGRTDSQEVGLEAAILYRKRNSSLVKRPCAKNVTGLKHDTEAAGSKSFGTESGRGALESPAKPYRKERWRPSKSLCRHE